MQTTALMGMIFMKGIHASAISPVDSTQISSPNNYGIAFSQPQSSTSVSGRVSTSDTLSPPFVEDTSGPATATISVGVYQGTSTSKSSADQSITAQAVVNGMDLQTCAEQVRFTNQQYTIFGNSLTGIQAQVGQSELRLQAIDVITHNILNDETNFSKEIDRVQQLYNTLAVRSNALGRWMSDEKLVRDNLQELYKEMVAKTSEEEQSLALMSANLKTALQRLADIEAQSSKVLSSVASAQNGMYGWASNVTVSVNTQTTKLESLKQSMQFRVSQLDTVIPEMANIAKRTMHIARSFGETNLAYAASNVLNQVQSLLQPVSSSDTVMSIPGGST